MTWVRIDEGFPEHPKVIEAGPNASWLHVCALAYCNRQLTNGFIPVQVAKRLSNGKRTLQHAETLVKVGLWITVDGGWQIHDYLHYQPSREHVEKERAKARERMAKARSSQNVPPNNSRSSEEVRVTRSDPIRTDPYIQVSDNSTLVDTPTAEGKSDLRINAVADNYARIAVECRKPPPDNPAAFARTARATALAHPDIGRYLQRWPTAPADAIAAWLHGDKHSMSYYHDTHDDEHATVHHLHGEPA